MKAFNKKRKPKHMSKNRWVNCYGDGFYLMNGVFCKAQSWGYASKFKFINIKLTKKWSYEKQY